MVSCINTAIGRLYNYGDDWIPSVTTILEYSKSVEQKAYLYNFRKNNEGYVNQAIEGGIQLHNAIETYLSTKVYPENLPSSLGDTPINLKGSFDILKPFLDTLTPVYLEHHLVSLQHGYAGTLDCIAYEGDTLLLIDWKTSLKYREKISWGTYPAQIAAYIQAANDTLKLPEKITQGKVVKIYQDGVHLPHIYHLTPSRYEKNLAKFNASKEAYYGLLKYLIKHNQL